MSRVAQASPNTWSVADDSGAIIGTITTSALGFVAWGVTGRPIGGYTSMAAATAAIESVASK